MKNKIRSIGQLIALTLLCSLALTPSKANAQDTLQDIIAIEKDGVVTMVGVEVGPPIMGRGFVNPTVTIPQVIAGNYYIIHYLAGGYSFSKGKQDEYVLSYGIGIPLYTLKEGILYGYLIDGYHHRSKKDNDFRQRRVKFAYRNDSYEFSMIYTLRYSLMVGVSYSFNN
tara:strand:- start:487 stop:993 length:507 start_codon:yes stop_codon:yes gene_type:complete